MKCRVAWDKAIEVVIGKGKIVTWSISKQPETAKVSIRSQPLLRWIKTLPKQNSVKKYFISVFSPAARSNYSVLTAFKPPSLLYTTRGCMQWPIARSKSIDVIFRSAPRPINRPTGPLDMLIAREKCENNSQISLNHLIIPQSGQFAGDTLLLQNVLLDFLLILSTISAFYSSQLARDQVSSVFLFQNLFRFDLQLRFCCHICQTLITPYQKLNSSY